MKSTTRPTAKQKAYRFFYRNAGYSYDPKTETKTQGRARCARQLAKAERDARALGYSYEWHYDADGCIGCTCGSADCPCSTGEPHEVLICVLVDGNGKPLESLCGICEPTREYRRVVEAELADQALN